MSTTIEWTQREGTKGETWNPTTGCNKVSAGCKHCYAEIMHRRLQAMGTKGYEHDFLDGARAQEHALLRPLSWKKPRTVFVNSMSDLFHADVPFEFIDQVFAVMALTPQHTYQILTKRPERMAEYLANRSDGLSSDCEGMVLDMAYRMDLVVWDDRGNAAHLYNHPVPSKETLSKRKPPPKWPLQNVWLGTSVEDHATAVERIPNLLKCPAAVRFLSCEPLLGLPRIGKWLEVCPNSKHVDGVSHGLRWDGDDPYTICDWCGEVRAAPSGMVIGSRHSVRSIHWVITGGESGHKARPMHPDWSRGLRDQCKAAGVPFFFKQWGQWLPSYEAGERAHDTANYRKSVGERWAASATYQQFPDGQGMVKVGKHAAGHLLDGVEHHEWPMVAVPETSKG